MLTNQLPFNGENEIAVIHSLFNTTPSPPSHVREGIPMWYDGFVSKCLQKNPNDRFQTMSEVRIALEREFPYHAPSV
jgi:serine/threonine-protein kinase